MHEATIAQSILNIVSTKLKQTSNAAQALNVHVIIGEFRNVDPVSLQFAFDNLRSFYEGCAACTLQAEIIQAKALCRKELHLYHPQFEQGFCCTTCGAGIGELICGEELDVVAIKLEAAANQDQKTQKMQKIRNIQKARRVQKIQKEQKRHARVGQ